MNSVRNIVFDLGGVILDIDYNRTRDAFIELGFKDFETIYSQAKQELIFDLLETGMITASDFRDVIRNYAEKNFTDSEIDAAWSAMIIGLPQERVNFLRKLKKPYRLFLLSNTNEIHEKEFTRKITAAFGKNILADLFEKSYYSHHIGMRKPNAEIFKLLLQENNLDTTETLFIDDSEQHVDGASKAGLTSILLNNKKTTLEKLLEKMADIKP
jgi:HAD superfamily hydrolase (TIGR01509 family)